MKQHLRSGFTLLELSIVLLIIALLTGGVMVGRSLIRSSQLQSVLREEDGYIKAVKEFQDKYQALPGDFVGAHAMWGITDGNGDGKIDKYGNGSGGTCVNSPWCYDEGFLVWEHLSAAGLIPGKYANYNGSSVNSGFMTPMYANVNVPASALTPGVWFMEYQGTTGLWPDRYGLLLFLSNAVMQQQCFANGLLCAGGTNQIYAQGTAPPVMLPSEAQAMDLKIDDGMPGTGMVRAWRTIAQPNCTANDVSQSTATYNTAYALKNACSPIFITGF